MRRQRSVTAREIREHGQSLFPVFALAATVLFASSGALADPKAAIGKDEVTGKPISLPKGRKHPILEETSKRFADGKVDKETVKKRILARKGDIVDFDFVYDVLTPAEQKDVSDWFRTQFYSRYGCSCNNGRPGAIFSWRIAIVLEDEILAGQVLSDIRHWLGHDTTCSGHSTDFRDYDYCYGGYPGEITAFARYVEGLDAATVRVAAYPRGDSDSHDGFVEKGRGPVVWKGMQAFHARYINLCVPSGHVPPINDSSDYVYRHKDVGTLPAGFDLRSRSMGSEVVLLSGKLNNDALWQKADPVVKERLPGSDAFYVLLDTAPDNDVHNHLDSLQILLWRWGKYLLWDIGSDCAGDGYTYENGRYTHQTYAHNTVVIDQLPQLPAHPKVLFFGEVPGLKAAEADAGWTHDAAFHRRILALTDDYLVDVNLLRPRQGHGKEAHDYDYLLCGPGTATIKLLGQTRPVRRKDDPSCEYWGAWPNLPVNYPYINWAEPYEVKGGFESTWEYDGVGLRTIVLSGDFIRGCIGHARHSNYDVQGLAKLYAGYRGSQAQFLSVIEPYQRESRIAAVERLDDSCCRIELKEGDIDYVQVNRRSPRFLAIRTNPGGAISSVRALAAKAVPIGKSAIEADGKELAGLALVLDGRTAHLFADSPEQQTLLVPLGKATSASAGGKPVPVKDGRMAISLPKGRTIMDIELDVAPEVLCSRDDLARLAASNEPREPTEVVDPYFPHTSTLVWDEAYRRPYVYADGAYWGENGISACSVAMSADGSRVVYGSYKGYVDCFTAEGKRTWRKYVTGRVIEDYFDRGKGVAVSPDGSFVAIGSTAGEAMLLDAKGQVVWETNRGEDVLGVAVDAAGTVLLATGKAISLVGKDGKERFSFAAPGPIDDLWLLDADKGALYCTHSGAVGRLDNAGKELWSYRSKWNTGIFTVIASPNGKKVYAGRRDNHVVALDGDGDVAWERFVEVPPVTMACSEDGKYLAVSGDGGRVYYFDSSGKLHWVFQCASMCYGIAMSADGRYVSAVATCGTVYLLSREGKVVSHNAVYTPEPVKCAMSADGKFTAVAGIGFDLLFFRNAVEP